MNGAVSTQELLLDLGEAAIRNRGYAGFSYGDIARDAGIRKASIHHHFPAKRDFGLAILDRYADRLARDLKMIEQRNRTGSQALGEAIKMYRDALNSGDQMCLCTSLAADRDLVSEEMRSLLAKANTMAAKWFEGILVKGRRDRSISVGGDPAVEATSMLAQLQGAQVLARAAGDPALFDRGVATITARLARH